MKIMLAIMAVLLAGLAVYQGLELATSDQPALAGYVGGLIPVLGGFMSGVCLVAAVCWDRIHPR